MATKESFAIGIDLGTTNSCVAVFRKDLDEAVLLNDMRNRKTPTCVAFSGTQQLVGGAAHYQVLVNPENTIYDAKRLIGKQFSEPSVQQDIEEWPFKVIEGPGDRPMILVTHMGEEKQLAAEDILSMVLTKIREIADSNLGSSVKSAVITVPAHFSNFQVEVMKDAGAKAGFDVLQIMDEPVAISLAYMLHHNWYSERKVVVFDLGGRQLKVTLLTVEEDDIQVRGTGGDANLGAEDFVKCMVSHCVKVFNEKNQADIGGDRKSVRRLRYACERAMCRLSSEPSAEITLEFLNNGIDFTFTFSDSLFDELTEHLIEKCLKPLSDLLDDSEIEKDQIDYAILAGGGSHIRKVQQRVNCMFPNKMINSLNPDFVVAYGAAIRAAMLTGTEVKRVNPKKGIWYRECLC